MLKRAFSFFICYGFVFAAKAQDLNMPGMIYRDSVPLFIQAALFSIATKPKNRITIISPKLKVSIAHATNFLVTDHIINILDLKGKTFTPFAVSQLQFRIISNPLNIGEWKPVNIEHNLIDTVLSPSAVITIQFKRHQEQNVIQQVTIVRDDIKPTIIALRSNSSSDTVNDKAASRQLFEYGTMPKNLTPFERGVINIKAGNDLELIIKSHSLYQDSVVEFSLTEADGVKSRAWILAGHFIRLDKLLAKHDYFLTFRYKGQRQIQKYQIRILPYWWQETWAIAVFFSIGIISILGMRYLILQRKRKQHQREVSLWLERTKTGHHKLDTHWVDNMFHTSLGFIRDNQNALADQYLTRASGILRDKLIYGDKPLIPLISDLKIMRDFTDNESIKSSFIYTIEVDPLLDIENIEVPPFLWQPSLENAIKHGVSDKSTLIEIKVLASESDLVYYIEDNGKYRENRQVKPGRQGMIITQERVNGFNMANPETLVKYEVSFNDSGTYVRFIFKNWLA